MTTFPAYSWFWLPVDYQRKMGSGQNGQTPFFSFGFVLSAVLEHEPEAGLGAPGVGSVGEAAGSGAESWCGGRANRGGRGGAGGDHEVGRGGCSLVRRREALRRNAGVADRIRQVEYFKEQGERHLLPEWKILAQARIEALPI